MTDKLPESAVGSHSYWHGVARHFRQNRTAVFGLAIICVLLSVAILADFLANDEPLMMHYQGRIYIPVLKDYAVQIGLSRWQPEFQNISFKRLAAESFKAGDWVLFPPVRYSPNDVDLNDTLQGPSVKHFFGTDESGRDNASRLIHGSRISLSIGFVAVSIYIVIGVFIGALAGYYGGVVDLLASRLIEIMLTIPTFFLVVTIVAFISPGLVNLIFVMGLTYWPTVARLTRGEFLKTKSLEYVVAARALGAKDFRTIFRHILPNTLAPVFVAATFGIGSAILIESTLSFLGFGVPPSTPSWGSILSSGRALLPSAWWLTAFPGLAIFLTVLSYNLVGEGLRDAADPRLKL
jgi:peptide/nickel transport system permease protein